MRNRKVFALLFITVFMASQAIAGTSVVGFELGVSTRNTIHAKLEEKGLDVVEGVELAFAHGKTIVVRGPAFEISGLFEVCFAFDQDEKLGFVGFLMEPERFEHMDQILAGKYTFLERHGEAPGARCSHYEAEDALIDLIFEDQAPLQVVYVRKDVRARADAAVLQEAEEAAKKEAENF